MPSQHALVTGGSRGIGRAAALALAVAGAHVLVHYGTSADDARSVVEQLRAKGGKADAVGADLAQTEGPAKLAAAVRQIVGDRLDILVANAGISRAKTIEETSIEDSMRSSRSTSARPIFSSSSCCRYRRKAPASFSPPRSSRAGQWAISPLMPQRRTRSTRW